MPLCQQQKAGITANTLKILTSSHKPAIITIVRVALLSMRSHTQLQII